MLWPRVLLDKLLCPVLTLSRVVMMMDKQIYYLCFGLLGKKTDNSKVETIKVMALWSFLATFLQRTQSSSNLSLSLTLSLLPCFLGGRGISINQMCQTCSYRCNCHFWLEVTRSCIVDLGGHDPHLSQLWIKCGDKNPSVGLWLKVSLPSVKEGAWSSGDVIWWRLTGGSQRAWSSGDSWWHPLAAQLSSPCRVGPAHRLCSLFSFLTLTTISPANQWVSESRVQGCFMPPGLGFSNASTPLALASRQKFSKGSSNWIPPHWEAGLASISPLELKQTSPGVLVCARVVKIPSIPHRSPSLCLHSTPSHNSARRLSLAARDKWATPVHSFSLPTWLCAHRTLSVAVRDTAIDPWGGEHRGPSFPKEA